MDNLTNCSDCGHGVSARAFDCPHCGAPLKKKPKGCLSGLGRLFMYSLLLVAIIAVIGPIIAENQEGANTLKVNDQPGRKSVVTAVKEPTSAEEFILNVIHSTGTSCSNISNLFFQGEVGGKDNYWNVACSNGGKYVVKLPKNPNEETSVMDCDMLKLVGAGECFKTFEELDYEKRH